MNNWDDLDYWKSKDWKTVQDKLDCVEKEGFLFNPKRELLFASLDATPFDKVKVAIYGQDPYPDRSLACGLAFAIPNGAHIKPFSLPPTLDSIIKEYMVDLHYPFPNSTNLMLWTDRGVLLWNSVPSCEWGKSMSHDWPEWASLTKEITQRLSDKGDIVFVFMGAVARRSVKDVDQENNTVLETSHPITAIRYPIRTSSRSFGGSRIFSHINDKLTQVHRTDPIDWKL